MSAPGTQQAAKKATGTFVLLGNDNGPVVGPMARRFVR